MSKMYSIFLCMVLMLALPLALLYYHFIDQDYIITVKHAKSGVVQMEFGHSYNVINLILMLTSFAIAIKAFIVDKNRKSEVEDVNKVINRLKSDQKPENNR